VTDDELIKEWTAGRLEDDSTDDLAAQHTERQLA
jgi:hypothetical protein